MPLGMGKTHFPIDSCGYLYISISIKPQNPFLEFKIMTNPLPAKTTVLFVDTTVQDYQQLINKVTPDTEVIILDPDRDGVEQISEVLASRQDIGSVQILSHGSEGAIYLGNGVLDGQTLDKYQQKIQDWGHALSEAGDILIWGCDVASGDQGKAFVARMAQLTQADVAASDDLTGNAAQGGNWTLEVQTGDVEATLPIDSQALAAYQAVLKIIKVTNTNDSGAGSLRQALLDSRSDGSEDDFIDLTGINGTINLNSSLPSIDSSMGNIHLLGNGSVDINGQDKYQIIAIDSSNGITFEGINFRDGYVRGGDGSGGGGGGLGAGGAIFINSGNVIINKSSFSSNSAVGGNATGQAGQGGWDKTSGGDGPDDLVFDEEGSNGGKGGRINASDNSDIYNKSDFNPGDGGVGAKNKQTTDGAGKAGAAGGFGSGGGGGGGGAGDPDNGQLAGKGGDGGNGGFGGIGSGGGGSGAIDGGTGRIGGTGGPGMVIITCV